MKKILLSLFTLSVLLCLLLTLGTSVSAESHTGSCGKNLTYTLDTDTGILTISGTGPMTDYDGGYDIWPTSLPSPFDNYSQEITTIIFSEGVTYISENAFRYCENIQNVYIPSTLTASARDSFPYNAKGVSVYITDLEAWCNISFSAETATPLNNGGNLYLNDVLLEDLVIPNGFTEVDSYAFMGVYSLKTVSIPDTVTTIGMGTFQFCKNIEVLDLRGNITKIWENAFRGCSGVKTLLLPDGLIEVGQSAFSGCSSLEEVALPMGITTIQNNLFSGCISLKKVTLPEDLKAIYPGMFENCFSLTEIAIPASVTSIEESAFTQCTSLTEIHLPAGLTSIGDYAFMQCSSLTGISIPDTVTSIGYAAFSTCPGLTEVVLPPNLTSISSGIFYNCTALDTVTFPAGIIEIGENAFYGTKYYSDPNNWEDGMFYIGTYLLDTTCPRTSESLHIRTDTTVIANSLFEYFSALTSVELPHGLVALGTDTFYACSNLTSVMFPSEMKFIGHGVFEGCTKLSHLVLPQKLGSIGSYAFYNCTSLTSFAVPQGVTSIGSYAFYDCTALASVTFPDTLNTIGMFAFHNNRVLVSITIPDSVHTLGYSAFSNCALLNYIELPDHPIVIDSFCFYLTAYQDNRNNWNGSYLYIGRHLIAESLSKSSIAIPEGTLSVAADALQNLNTLIVPESVGAFGTDPYLDKVSTIVILNPDCIIFDTLRPASVYGHYGSTAETAANSFYALCECTGDLADFDVTYPSCGESGDVVYTCHTCNTTRTFSVTKPVSHMLNISKDSIPTCTEAGSYHNTCYNCDYDEQITVPALGHDYTKYTFNGITHIVECGICHYSYTEYHNFGQSTCSYCKVTSSEKFEGTIYHSLNLESNISVNYIIKEEDLADFDAFYLQYRMSVYVGDSYRSYFHKQLQPELKNGYYYFTLDEIHAGQMNDTISAFLVAEKNGEVYLSAWDEYSIATYAYNLLNKSTADPALKALCADLLVYGSRTQIFKGYRTYILADSSMTETHKSYLTDLQTVPFGNTDTVLKDMDAPVITWHGKGLVLDSTVALKFVFDPAAYEGDLSELTLRGSYTNAKGELKTFEVGEATLYNKEKNVYAFTVQDLLAIDLRAVVSVQVYNGETPLSCTLQYSADSYGNGRTGDLLTLCKALFAYSDSAKAYFVDK